MQKNINGPLSKTIKELDRILNKLEQETTKEIKTKEKENEMTYENKLEKTNRVFNGKKILSAIGHILVGILMVWMIAKTGYRIGFVEGEKYAQKDYINCEMRLDEAIDKCNDMIEEAKQKVLEQF